MTSGPHVRALVRRHPNIRPTYVAVDGGIFLDALPALFRSTAAPASNLSNLTWGTAIREVQREAGVRVPLVGGAGNGSLSLDGEILWDLLRAGRLGELAAEWRADPGAFGRSCRVLAQAPRDRHGLSPRILLSADAAAEIRHAPRRAFPSIATARTRFQQIAAGAIGAGYAGLERIDPMRDRRLVDFCRRLPPQEFRHGGERRRLVRRAMEGLLPDEIRLRTTRGAQAPDAWMHFRRRIDDLRAAVAFVADDPLCRQLIDIGALQACVGDWSGRDEPVSPGTLSVFERTLAMGLYIRWIQDRLTDLPGTRQLRYLVLDDR